MQTFVIYCKSCFNGKNNMKCLDHITILFFIGLPTYIFMILPWALLGYAIFDYGSLKLLGEFNIYFGLLYIYILVISVYISFKEIIGFRIKIQDCIAILLYPFYFCLHSIAVYKALWSLIVDPFKWNKTTHGISIYVDHEIKNDL